MATFNVSDYVDVQDRITRFWAGCEAANREGFITSEVLSDPNNDMFIIIRSTVGYYSGPGVPVVQATGIASEVRSYADNRGTKGHSQVNETSWVENCETSAIGRAFANLGYATTGADRPSRQEMEKVERYEDAPAPVRQAQPYQAQQQRGGFQQGQQAPQVQQPDAAITDRQSGYLTGLLRERKLDPDLTAMAVYGKGINELTRGEASDFIKSITEGHNFDATPDPNAPQQTTLPNTDQVEHQY